MEITLNDLCGEVNNYFDKSRFFGTFEVSDGSIDLAETGIVTNQYFRIVDSMFNDGVYKYPVSDLEDETFDGAVWLMSVPSEVLSLLADINTWVAKFGAVDGQANSPYTSESYSGYSYSKDTSNGDAGSWQSQFKSRLNKYRKLSAI